MFWKALVRLYRSINAIIYFTVEGQNATQRNGSNPSYVCKQLKLQSLGHTSSDEGPETIL
jgi:hypothetical protein